MNKRVLITGCSSGLGKALCEILFERGYFVIATARCFDSLECVKANMKLELDVTDVEQVMRVVDEAGPIDILVNNAGFSVRSAIEEIDIEKYQKMMDVNVVGIIRMIQAVIPVMRMQKGGRIINIGSISGKMTSLVNGGYCSTKHAVEAITEAARYELRNMNIDATVIEPGAMDTEFFHTLSKNSDVAMQNVNSPYAKLYKRDQAFRSKQSRTPVERCAEEIVGIMEKHRLSVRYTVAVSWFYRLFCRLPDGMKEMLLLKFN